MVSSVDSMGSVDARPSSPCSSGGSSELPLTVEPLAAVSIAADGVSSIFQAAHQSVQNVHIALGDERRKNADLWAFLTSAGHTPFEINRFVARGGSSLMGAEAAGGRCGGMMVPVLPVAVASESSGGSGSGSGRVSPGSLVGGILPGVKGPSGADALPIEVNDAVSVAGQRLLVGGGSNVRLLGASLPARSCSEQACMAAEGPTSSLGPPLSHPNSISNSNLDAGLPLAASVPGLAAPSVSGSAPVPGVRPTPWADVVAASRQSASLSYFPPLSSEEGVIIKPPPAVLRRGSQLWSSCLVGRFLKSRPPFPLVRDQALKLWGHLGLVKVMMKGRDTFIFRFDSPDRRDHVLALGPWYFSNKLILLQAWAEGLDFQRAVFTKLPVWVRFHDVPLSYWSQEGLSYLASGVGRPLFMDDLTAKLEPLPFARICVEISAAQELPSSLRVVLLHDGTGAEMEVVVRVEYMNKPLSCQHCKCFGHATLKCPNANYVWQPKPVASPASLSPSPAVAPPTSESPSSPAAIKVPASPVAQVLPATPEPSLASSPVPAASVVSASSSESSLPNPLVAKLRRVDELEGLAAGPDSKDGWTVHHSKRSKKKKRRGRSGGGAPSRS